MIKIIILFTCLISMNSQSLNAQEKIKSEWLTHFEKSNYFETARYDETIAYYKMLDAASPYAKLISIGVSPQGREIYSLVVSKDKAFTPELAKKTGKPIVLIINGIHSGEIDGKDASKILLREILITGEKKSLIDNAIILVNPVFNVDGHEQFGPYNRINQNGPREMGWRTTANNLNLNRDWLKADSPEMQAMLKLFSEWLPDFFADTHTTNGADYQYTVTWGLERSANMDNNLVRIIDDKFLPFMKSRMDESGYLTMPYAWFRQEDISKGIAYGVALPRFSNGYGSAQNRISLLVETHMLKPYKTRVFATKRMLEIVLEFANENQKELVSANRKADEDAIKNFYSEKLPMPIQFKLAERSEPYTFKGKKYIVDTSEISGARRITYTNEDKDYVIPFFGESDVVHSVVAPKFYYVPKEWGIIVERLKFHGVKFEVLEADKNVEVTKYKFKNVKFQQNPYEGRHHVNFEFDKLKKNATLKKGGYLISPNQRTIRLILYALEPSSEDSFVQWGFLNSIFERKEYFEFYVMERIAKEMLEANPELKKEFEKKLLEDEKFRNDSFARLNFFYLKSNYSDEELNLYPIFRIEH